MYTSRQIYGICTQENFAAAGSEGLIFIDPASGRFFKEKLLSLTTLSPSKKDANHGRIYDPLAERKRKHIHKIANIALSATKDFLKDSGVHNSNDQAKVDFAHIEQAATNAHSSFSIMQEVKGTPSTTDIDVIALAERVQTLSCNVDVRGQNIFVKDNGDITILEVVGGIHPEILKSAALIPAKNRKLLLKELAKLYLLGGCNGYPTVNPFFALPERFYTDGKSGIWESISNRFDNFTGDRRNAFRLADHNLKLRRDGKPQIAMKEYFIQTEELEGLSAWKFFGDRFVPEPFDWDKGSNLSNYGIQRSVFRQFRQECNRLHLQFDRVRETPPTGKEIPITKRAMLLERIAAIGMGIKGL